MPSSASRSLRRRRLNGREARIQTGGLPTQAVRSAINQEPAIPAEGTWGLSLSLTIASRPPAPGQAHEHNASAWYVPKSVLRRRKGNRVLPNASDQTRTRGWLAMGRA